MEPFRSFPDVLNCSWCRYDTDGWSNNHDLLLGDVQLQILLLYNQGHFLWNPSVLFLMFLIVVGADTIQMVGQTIMTCY